MGAVVSHSPRGRFSTLGTSVLIIGYGLWNFLAVRVAQPQESYDTYRYFGLIFDVQNPGFTTTALFLFLNDHSRIVYTLTGISFIVWSVLALAVLHRLRFTGVRWPIAVLTLLISLTTPVWNYNTVLLTESLTVSTFILWFAAIVWLASSTHSKS